jgi:hypothetical protein
MRKSNKSKLSSLNKSIENFFIKFLNKTKNGGVTINKKIKSTHSNSILNKSSPIKLINKYLATSEQKKYAENCEKVIDNEPVKKNEDEILIQNILNKLNDKTSTAGQNGINEETSILKYLIESINNSTYLDETQVDNKNEKDESNEQDTNESDDSYASAIIHDTSNSSSNDSNNATFLIHENDKETETQNNYLSNIQQTIILKALLESYPNLIENLSLNDKKCDNELPLDKNGKDFPDEQEEEENDDNNDENADINSSVIIHNEPEQQSDSLNNSKNSDQSHNDTFLIHNDQDENYYSR